MQVVAVLLRRVHVDERHDAARAAGLRCRRRERRVVMHAQVLRRAGSASLMQGRVAHPTLPYPTSDPGVQQLPWGVRRCPRSGAC